MAGRLQLKNGIMPIMRRDVCGSTGGTLRSTKELRLESHICSHPWHEAEICCRTGDSTPYHLWTHVFTLAMYGQAEA